MLGAAHPDTLRTAGELAAQLLKLARYGDSEALVEESLEAAGGTERLQDPDSMRLLDSLAQLRVAQGRLGEAADLLETLLERKHALMGEEIPTSLVTATNLGRVYIHLRRFDEAEERLERTLAAQRRVLSEAHPDTRTTVGNLLRLYLEKGDGGRALDYQRDYVHLTRLILGADHRDSLNEVYVFARALAEAGRSEEAEPLFQEAADGFEQGFPGSYFAAATRLDHGLCLLELGDNGRATPVLEHAFELHEEALPAGDARISWAAETLIDCFTQMGDDERADRYREKLYGED